MRTASGGVEEKTKRQLDQLLSALPSELPNSTDSDLLSLSSSGVYSPVSPETPGTPTSERKLFKGKGIVKFEYLIADWVVAPLHLFLYVIFGGLLAIIQLISYVPYCTFLEKKLIENIIFFKTRKFCINFGSEICLCSRVYIVLSLIEFK